MSLEIGPVTDSLSKRFHRWIRNRGDLPPRFNVSANQLIDYCHEMTAHTRKLYGVGWRYDPPHFRGIELVVRDED